MPRSLAETPDRVTTFGPGIYLRSRMGLDSLRNTRDGRLREEGGGGRGKEETTEDGGAEVDGGEKDGGPEDRTWLEQLMPGEPLGVTRPVTSYLDTFSLAPPLSPCRLSLPTFARCHSALSSHEGTASSRYQRKSSPTPLPSLSASSSFLLRVARFSSPSSFPRRGFLRLPLSGGSPLPSREKPYRYAFNVQFLRASLPLRRRHRRERKTPDEFSQLRMTLHCWQRFLPV